RPSLLCPPCHSSLASAGRPPPRPTPVPDKTPLRSFTGTAGQRVSVALSAGSMGSEKLSLLAPDGSTIIAQSFSNSGYLDVRTLLSSGTYTLLHDPPNTHLGSLPLKHLDVPDYAHPS